MNPIKINSTIEIPIIISNYNPVDVDFNKFEISTTPSNQRVLNKNSNEQDYSIKNKLNLKFVRFEPLRNHSEHGQVFINKSFENEQIKTHLKVPAMHKMIVTLTIDSRVQGNADHFFNSILYEHELLVSTRYKLTHTTRVKISAYLNAIQRELN